ncbi:hypothetical protein [Streptomyces sp. NPDC056431]|uniref:hypothetical protein n=1 Tax=Streptomyces sp. NPDC056431 TaxID=3345814 RepID=UPI0036AD6812
MGTAPDPAVLLDHRGNVRPTLPAVLGYEDSRLGLAFHEAGHAVLAMSYGFHLLSTEVVYWEPEPDRWNLTGLTTIASEDVIPPWKFGAQAAAGTVAEVRYLMTSGLWTPERAAACDAEHDRRHAIDTAAETGHRIACDHVPPGGKSWGQVRGMALRKIGLLWREIRTVAHAMNEHTKLTGEQVAAMTGLANPPMPGAVA